MNLVYGEIVNVFSEDGLPGAKVRVGSALKRLSIALMIGMASGDTVLVCDGMVIGKVENVRKDSNVFGYSR
jgi:hydrogenase maturation factor